jgi:hypothetical protein
MLTREEETFIAWWDANRNRQKKIRNRWFIALPSGLMFGLPVLLNVFSGWNKRVQAITGGQMMVVIVAILGIVAFMAVFSVQHKWEMREQQYRELMHKKNREAQNANETSSV